MHELERDILNIDSNVIDIKKFEKLISNNDQGYKFYWLESLMRLIPSDKEYFTFEEIIDEMIWGAWRSVTYYHLRLGHTVNGKPVNFLEHAVLELNKCIEKDNKELLNQNLSKNKIQALFSLLLKFSFLFLPLIS